MDGGGMRGIVTVRMLKELEVRRWLLTGGKRLVGKFSEEKEARGGTASDTVCDWPPGAHWAQRV